MGGAERDDWEMTCTPDLLSTICSEKSGFHATEQPG